MNIVLSWMADGLKIPRLLNGWPIFMAASIRFSWCPCPLGRPFCESQGHPIAARDNVFGRLLSGGVSIVAARANESKRLFDAKQLLQPAPSTVGLAKRCQPVAIHQIRTFRC